MSEFSSALLLYFAAPVSVEFQECVMNLQILAVANIFEPDGTGLQHNAYLFGVPEPGMKQLDHHHQFFRMLQLVSDKLKPVREQF